MAEDSKQKVELKGKLENEWSICSDDTKIRRKGLSEYPFSFIFWVWECTESL